MLTSSPVSDGAHASARAPAFVYCGGREALFIAAAAFSVRIIAGNYVCRAPQVWLIACAVAAIGVCVVSWRAPSLAFPLAILALVPLGALYLQVFDAALTTLRTSRHLQPANAPLTSLATWCAKASCATVRM
ncbi:MAG TPA: hypothetical protein VGG59_14325 [Acidobacteriaceae bacterium]